MLGAFATGAAISAVGAFALDRAAGLGARGYTRPCEANAALHAEIEMFQEIR